MKYIAHISNYNLEEQTVKEHCSAVAEMSAGFGKTFGAETLAYLQGIIHDFGKLSTDFNNYLHGDSNFSRGEIDHSFAGAKYIYNFAWQFKSMRLLNTAAFAARTVISHHSLHDWIDADGEDYFKKRISKDDRYLEISAAAPEIISDDELKTLLYKASDERKTLNRKISDLAGQDGTSLCFYVGMLERLMQSVLIDADRTDTADFMSGQRTTQEILTPQLWNVMQQKINEKCDNFRKKTDPVSRQRMSISDRCAAFAGHHVGICRLVVPTGGGKTLSSLRFAIEYCRNYNMDKIIYVAPFMSILEQNSDVIKEISGDEAFLEHYSDMEINITDSEELAEYELRCDKWDNPVIATTLVQFLNTLFSGKGSSVRRMHRLCNSVIIIDEVQSIPVKCVHLFNFAMNFLSHICDCAIVLCSATQPSFEKTVYPLLTDADESMTGDYSADFEAFRRVDFINSVTSKGYTYREAAEFCFQKYLSSGSLLAVLNTKTSALEIYREISELNRNVAEENRAEIVHLSKNMCPAHRRSILNRVRQMLSENKKIICVTTQLIEAGVDISFKCVVRSLAGLDNAVQAAGRCNRNGEHDICPVYVIRINEEKLGSLNEIKAAQDITTCLLSQNSFDDFLSVEALSVYFQNKYREALNELSFNVTDIGLKTTLVDMLSNNPLRYTSEKENLYPHVQAFKTAGILFKVIDEGNTNDIIVPFNNEAKEIITALSSQLFPDELSALMRKAQKYIVSIYPNAKKILEEKGAFYQAGNGTVTVLKEGFYDEATGVNPDGSDAFEFYI